MIKQTRRCFNTFMFAIIFCGILHILICHSSINRNAFFKNSPLEKQEHVKTIIHNSTYILSSIANLDIEKKTYPNVYLFGWKKFSPTLYCCYLYDDGRNLPDTSESLYDITKANSKYRYSAVRYSCPIYNQRDLPSGVTLRLEGQSCPAAKDFLKVYYPTVHTGQLAMCLQIAYGKLNVRNLVAWFEMQRLLGVTFVVVVVKDDLSDDAKKVFQHYHDEGFAYVHPFELIEKSKYPFDHLFPHFLTEGRIVLTHCFAAMRGYSYASVLDTDEFIIPSTKQTLIHLIENTLTQTTPNASGFIFQQELFEMEKRDRDKGMFFGQLLFRLAPTKERMKCIYVNNRTTDIIIPHSFRHPRAFKALHVDPEVAAFHHYRVCPFYLQCDAKKYRDVGFLNYMNELEPAMNNTLLKMGSMWG